MSLRDFLPCSVMRWRHQLGADVRGVWKHTDPLIHIENATFYRRFPSRNERDSPNPPLFPSLSFAFSPSNTKHWAIIAPSNHGKTTLLEILRGQHICVPPNSRSFPFLSSPWIDQAYREPARAIQHVGFDGESGTAKATGTRGAYLSARYESRREENDFTVRDYMLGNTDLNALVEKHGITTKETLLEQVVAEFKLEALIDMPMSKLSNGQIRRTRIAKALLGQPMVLLLDEPFMGLDPPTVQKLSQLLYDLASASAPQLILSLRPQDPCPDWITHVLQLDEPLRLTRIGKRNRLVAHSNDQSSVNSHVTLAMPYSEASSPDSQSDSAQVPSSKNISNSDLSKEGLLMQPTKGPAQNDGAVLMSMKGVEVKYGDKVALGGWEQKLDTGESSPQGKGMWWEVRRGQRWGVFGGNGSGKTTLISLICSDHPQAYSQPLEIFGRSRLPKLGSPGISIFDIQTRIGQSSPEIHAFFPKNLSLRQTLMSSWAETFLGPPKMMAADHATVDAVLRWFEPELNPPSTSHAEPSSGNAKPDQFDSMRHSQSLAWADNSLFGQSPFSVQRVALFLRAIIRKSDLVVLDEAFSGMDEAVRNKCMLFLTHGESLALSAAMVRNQSRAFLSPPEELFKGRQRVTGLSEEQALICISHVKEEVPGIVRHWVRLPEPNSGEAPQFGELDRPLEADDTLWKTIWAL